MTGNAEFRLVEIGNTQVEGASVTASDGMFRVVDHYQSGVFTDTQFTGEVRAVPIPAALPLLASALAGLGMIGCRKRKVA